MKKRLFRLFCGLVCVLFVLLSAGLVWRYVSGPSERTLFPVIEGCTLVRVRSGGLCHRSVEHERTLFEMHDQTEIRALISHIQIHEIGSGFHCMCCGNPTFEFYQHTKLLASLGFHHGRSIRWNSWNGDGLLTKESAVFLISLLERHGAMAEDYR